MILKIFFLKMLLISLLFSNKYNFNELNNFNDNVKEGLKYLRIEFSDNKQPTLVENNNKIFQITINPRRNNYEESVMMAFSCIGKIINQRLLLNTYNENIFIPSIVIVHCNVPIGRNGTYFKTSSTFIILDSFITGAINASTFWNEIISTTEYLSNELYLNKDPSFFRENVEYENLIASRIAIENKNDPNSANLISMALKSKYIPGLQGQLESMLMKHMKSKHSKLMNDVLGSSPSDEQLLRLGKLIFIHIQKPINELQKIHTMDSIRFLWNGGKYPISINEFYLRNSNN
ncbi:MAG: hypothetical protein CMF98_06555 [Candidatus Marinimicrobia bacterium]|nr:hypothetical protein [Candidatus Neomarinimicrobiota bacterium]